MSNLDELFKVFAAMGHVMRLRIVLALREGERGPKEVAAQFGEPLGVVGYRFRQLARSGLIQETRTESARGAIAHFYVLTHEALELLDRLGFNDAATREP